MIVSTLYLLLRRWRANWGLKCRESVAIARRTLGAAKSAIGCRRWRAELLEFYQRQLRSHPKRMRAVTYLKGRGLTGEIAPGMQLGYACYLDSSDGG